MSPGKRVRFGKQIKAGNLFDRKKGMLNMLVSFDESGEEVETLFEENIWFSLLNK